MTHERMRHTIETEDREYHLIKKLGSGGMGSVWIAERHSKDDPDNIKEVAIKFSIKKGENLRKEAQYLSMLDHPNIVGIDYVGDIKEIKKNTGERVKIDSPLLELEHIKGMSLYEIVNKHYKKYDIFCRNYISTHSQNITSLEAALKENLNDIGILGRIKRFFCSGKKDKKQDGGCSSNPEDFMTLSKISRLPDIISAHIALHITRAVDHMHRIRPYKQFPGLVHRDITARNIMISSVDGNAKLIDFGISEPIDEASRSKFSIFGDIKIIGTTTYLAPEVLNGLFFPQSDLYQIGINMYLMLTGINPTRPYKNKVKRNLTKRDYIKSITEIYHNMKKDLVPPGELVDNVDPALSKITCRLLKFEKNDRYQTAEELAEELEKYVETKQPQEELLKDAVREHVKTISNEIDENLFRYLQYRIHKDAINKSDNHKNPARKD